MESLGYWILFGLLSPFLAFACCSILTVAIVLLSFALRDQDLPKFRKKS
jgi:hypothetical protein